MTKRLILAAFAAVLAAPQSALHATEPIAAFVPGARILFQGDSITGGNRGRSADPNHILQVYDVHPAYSGHQILADAWERAVREYWK
jgi:hypothetical protein